MSAVEQNVKPSAERSAAAGRDNAIEASHLTSVAESQGPSSVEGRLMRRLLSALGEPPIEFKLWNGELIRGPNPHVTARIGIQDRATLLGLARDPQVRFGDAYSDG